MVRNQLPGQVGGSVIQAGEVRDVHFHARWEPVVPAQLPAPPAILPGRVPELAHLDEAWSASAAKRPPLMVITGPGGVGKTTLALQWLHHTRERYPQGQLYVDLGAATPGGPIDPGTALEWFLTALGMPSEDIPAQLAQREAVFRSVVADRPVAVLLDNAVSAAQVRPLIPTTTSGAVVVTSRWRLGALALQGDHLELEPWTVEQSVEALAELLDSERVAAEPDAARTIAVACGGLPLALSMVAARLQSRPHRDLATEATALSRGSRVLRMAPDGEASLQSVLDTSLSSVSGPAAGLYRLCGLHPGDRVGLSVLMDVSSRPVEQVEDAVDELVESNLLVEEPHGRLRMHDLVRQHAHDRAHRDVTDQDQDAAVRRFVEWYLTGAVAASQVAHPYRWRLQPELPTPAPGPAQCADRAEAMEWLRAQQQPIQAAAREAYRRGWFDLVWRFCEALWTLFLHHRHYQDWIDLQRLGIEAAQHCGHRLAEARLRSQLGFAYAKLGRYGEAITENELALRLGKAERHDPTIATAVSQLGRAARGQGDLTAALNHFREAERLHARLGIDRGVALSRRRAGDVLADLGHLEEAIAELTAAAQMMAEIGDRTQQARTLLALGSLLGRHGRSEEGLVLLGEALEMVRGLDSPHYTAEVLSALGEVENRQGDTASARRHWREAHEFYAATDDPRAEDVRSRLQTLQDTVG